MESPSLRFSVGDFIALTNQVLDGAYPSVEIEGEVSSFKVNQGKYVFFDIKDDEGTLGCFMMVFALRIPIEDGMRVVVKAQPRLTKWGKFSLTVSQVRPVGEGNIKKSLALLRAKLEKEGLFDEARKRPLPLMPARVGVISSTQAAGYADFIKIISSRWGGMQIDVAHVQVQGETAADQMIAALRYFNQQSEMPEVLVVIRGGGSADDLASFNDELLVREIAASRIPVMTGIGHEVDTSLADLVADVRASTPSNAAERLVPDRQEVAARVMQLRQRMVTSIDHGIAVIEQDKRLALTRAVDAASGALLRYETELRHAGEMLKVLDPRAVLSRGYAMLRGEIAVGQVLEVETAKMIIQTEVRDVREK